MIVFVMLSCLFLEACSHLLGKGWPLGSLVCCFRLCLVTFSYGVSGQVWYLIVLISDICLLLYLLNFFCSGIQLYVLLGPYFCLIFFLYIDLYVLGGTATGGLVLLSFGCLVTVGVLWLILAVPWVGLQCMSVLFPDPTQSLFGDNTSTN